ncbi:MAG TPA: ParB/RepB/Spo0J family partition protein [Bacteroidales bacterium]|nr:ParB/RepB/Spo0J family partition protein [Bacteroidales bacterium]
MVAKKNALGRGLGALIEEKGEDAKEIIDAVAAANEIPVKSIEVNPFQPRTQFNEEALEELVSSIKELGIIQPLTVRKHDNKFQLITGERRLRAAMKAGLKKVPAFIREADDDNMLEFALVENIQREDLDAIEVALSYQRLIDEVKLTQETLSERVGKKRATVTNYLRLLKLPADIQAGIRDKRLSMGQAKALIAIEDPKKQIEVYEKVIEKELSVRQVETLVAAMKKKSESKGDSANVPQSNVKYDKLRSRLTEILGSTIDFKTNNKGAGKIVIPFDSEEDLHRIVSKFDKPD